MELLPSGTWERLRDGKLKVRKTQEELGLEALPQRADMAPRYYQQLAIEALDRGLIRLEARRIAQLLREDFEGATEIDLYQV